MELKEASTKGLIDFINCNFFDFRRRYANFTKPKTNDEIFKMISRKFYKTESAKNKIIEKRFGKYMRSFETEIARLEKFNN